MRAKSLRDNKFFRDHAATPPIMSCAWCACACACRRCGCGRAPGMIAVKTAPFPGCPARLHEPSGSSAAGSPTRPFPALTPEQPITRDDEFPGSVITTRAGGYARLHRGRQSHQVIALTASGQSDSRVRSRSCLLVLWPLIGATAGDRGRRGRGRVLPDPLVLPGVVVLLVVAARPVDGDQLADYLLAMGAGPARHLVGAHVDLPLGAGRWIQHGAFGCLKGNSSADRSSAWPT